jgi:hypothetical protein
MSLQDLGSLGEFIAAIATLVTLVYLAIQIRQNTKSVRASSFHDAISDFAHGIEELNKDPELTRIFYAGLANFEDLSQLERQRFATYFTAVLRRYESILYQTRRGTLEPEALSDMRRHLGYALSQPGSRAWWNQASYLFNEELKEHVESELLETKSPSGRSTVDEDR